jgi:hypothetical protein
METIQSLSKKINFKYYHSLLFILISFLGINNFYAQTGFTATAPGGGGMSYTGTFGTNECVMTVVRPTSGCYAYGIDLSRNISGNSNGFTFNTSFTGVHANPFTYSSGVGGQSLILIATTQTMSACTGRSAITIAPYLVLQITTPGVNWYRQGNFFYFSTKSGNVSVNVRLTNGSAGSYVNVVANNLCTTSWHSWSNLYWGWFTLAAPTAAPSNTGSYCTGETISLTANPSTTNAASTPATSWTYAWTGPASFTSTTANPTRAASTTNEGAYNVTVTDNYGCPSTAASTTVEVQSTPTAGTINNAQTICYNTTPAPIGNATVGIGDGPITYRWEQTISPFTTWVAAVGTISGATFQPPALTQTTRYRRITISTQSAKACESATATTPIEITVQSVPTAGSIGNAQTICNNTTPSAISNTAVGTGSGTISYRWESSVSPFTTWNPESGSGPTFSPPALTETTQYRRITISTLNGVACESTNTSPVQITVQSVPTAGSIGNAQTICNNTTPSAISNTAVGTGDGTITYRWEQAVSPFTTWTTASGTIFGATFTPSALTATTQFRRITISTLSGNVCESTNTSPIEITVQSVPNAGAIGNAQTICNGVDPAAISSTTDGTGSGTITYRWENSISPFTTWNTIVGETGSTYDPSVLTQTTRYRRFAISTLSGNACESATAATPIEITVQSVPTAGVIGNAQTICNGGNPTAISSTTAGTGSGTISYRWESSVSPFSTWNSESGSGATFSPSALTQTTQYRRLTISTLSGNICESTSATTPIQITVQSVPTAGTISSSNIVVCTDGDPAAFNNDVSGTGDGTISYRWEKSVDPFSSWTTIGSATGATYDPPAPLPQTTKYRRYTVSTVGANVCESSSPSNEITIYTDDNNSGGTIANTNSTRTCVINDANWHYFRNDAGEVIAAVNSNGEDLGSTTMTVTIEDNLHTYNSVDYDSPEHGDGGLGRNGACYGLPELSMRRWYTITPTNQPTANCNVKLFFTAADYANYASEISSWDTDHTGQNSYSFCYGSTSNNLDLVISKDESYDLLSVIGKSATGGPGGTTEYEFTVPSFSTFRFHTTSGIGGPLPVELLSFNGYFSNSSNVLEWVTLSEINSQKFVIEKSINATNWTAIGEVAAAGNSNQRLEYTFIDVNPEVGNNYYRLKIIDFDGTYSYSGVIDILVDGITENKIVNLYPNPTNGSTTITATLSSVQNQTARIDIVDMLGRIMLSQNVELTSGYNNIKLDVNVLNGTYVLRYIDNNGKNHYGKFIKN